MHGGQKLPHPLRVLAVERITANKARYIKLGDTGRWEELAFEEGFIPLQYQNVPHEIAVTLDKNKIRNCLIADGKVPRSASDHTRQILDFYTLDETTLWITFTSNYLCWCFAEPGVIPSQPDEIAIKGHRYRRVRGAWHNTNLRGEPLYLTGISGDLAKKGMYRQTICDIYPDQLEYLLRKINGEEQEVVKEATRARQALLASIESLMKLLQPADFEVLVDLVFSQSGWRRLGAVGGVKKTSDMELELPSTGERAFIQVKSDTRQSELDAYVKQLKTRGDARMFFAYHTCKGELACVNSQVILLGPQRLSEMVLGAGLFDWLMQKV